MVGHGNVKTAWPYTALGAAQNRSKGTMCCVYLVIAFAQTSNVID